MKRKDFLILLMMVILFGCTKKEYSEPLKGFELGMQENEWKNKIESFKDEKIFTNESSYKKDERTYCDYSSFIEYKRAKIKVDYLLNDDGFSFSTLRSVTIKPQAVDSINTIVYLHTTMTSKGLKSNNIDILLNYLENYYGDPDSIQYLYFNSNYDPLYLSKKLLTKWNLNASNLFQTDNYVLNSTIENSGSIPEVSIFWKERDFEICYHLYRPSIEVNDPNILLYGNSEIQFKINNYEKYYSVILDSIRSNYTLDQIVIPKIDISFENLSPINNQGRNQKFWMNLTSFYRQAKEEERGIESIRFNVAFYNRFNELIFKTEDLEYHFKEPWYLYMDKSRMTSMNGKNIRDYSYSIRYDNRNKDEDTKNFEYIRTNIDNMVIKPQTLAISFSDGTVRKIE